MMAEDKKKKKLKNIAKSKAKGKSMTTGRSGSKYVTRGKYKLGGERLYTGKTYEKRGTTYNIDDIANNAHLNHRSVVSYVRNLPGGYGGYMWKGEVMKISGSTANSQGKA